MSPTSGRAIAWISFLLGIIVSVFGNIAHATSDAWTIPEVIGSAFWPLALMLSIEVLTRVHWVSGKRWVVARFAGLVAVAAVAAVLSYRHLAGLMATWGEDPFNAHLGPLAVDGLMLLSATALLSISRAQADARDKASRAAAAAEAKAARQVEVPTRSKPKPKVIEVLTEQPEEAPATEPEKLHIVNSVPATVSEEAARQAYLQSDKQMSVREIAAIGGMSVSTAHRRIQRWSTQGVSR